MKVHIVLRVGPEWTDIIGVYANKKEARRVAEQKQKGRDLNNVFERISDYRSEEHVVEGEGK